jgi:hypothetical protein
MTTILQGFIFQRLHWWPSTDGVSEQNQDFRPVGILDPLHPMF